MDLKIGEFPMATTSRSAGTHVMSPSARNELTELLGPKHPRADFYPEAVHPLQPLDLVASVLGSYPTLVELIDRKPPPKVYARAMERIQSDCNSLIATLEGTDGWIKAAFSDDAMVEETKEAILRLREAAQGVRTFHASFDARGRTKQNALRNTISELVKIFEVYAGWPPDPVTVKPLKRRYLRAQKRLSFVRVALDDARIPYPVGNNEPEKRLQALLPGWLKDLATKNAED